MGPSCKVDRKLCKCEGDVRKAMQSQVMVVNNTVPSFACSSVMFLAGKNRCAIRS